MSWLLAFVGFALLVILHELGHFGAAKAVGMRVERFSLFFPPLIARKKVGETEYAIGSVPLGGYVKITGMNPDEDLPDEVRTRAYYSQPVWKRIVVIAAGPAMNLVIAFVLLFVFFTAIGPQTTSRSVRSVETSYPAAGVVKPGDRLVAVDGRGGTPADLSNRIASHRCAQQPPERGCKAKTPVTLTLERNGERRTVRITPIYDPAAERNRLGFAYAPGPRDPLSISEGFTDTTDAFWFITRETIKLPARLLDSQDRKEISGVVGSYEVTRQTIVSDFADAVWILAIISLSLAIVNLFPFLPLDGGHIFWAIVEKVRGRPVPFSVMERAGVVGFMLVILLFLVGLSNDIDRLSGEGFRVR
ncbi:MAG: site-2 protease family protein [Thermoleophilaceae bacterium]|nr:site-2 protease family protein [Thermoleophilaceae bacterium]